MAKMVPLKIDVTVEVVKVHDSTSPDGTWTMTDTEFRNELGDAWEQGLRHALAWLGLKHYGDVMTKDNPHRKAEG